MPKLSAIVIAKDEAKNISDCLDALQFCDECIVVDGGSSDDTMRLAEGKGAQVVSHEWTGFGAQKNFALSLAQGEWVMSVDADERVSPALAFAIKQAIIAGGADGFVMPRLSRFCGRQMRHSGWYPDHVLRLFRRGRARFSDDAVHERVICDGPVSRISEPLLHNPVGKLEDALSRMDRYSTIGADMLIATGKRVSFMSGIFHGILTFLRAYILRLGFLDGREGFLLAFANAEGTYYRYMKAWLAGRTRG